MLYGSKVKLPSESGTSPNVLISCPMIKISWGFHYKPFITLRAKVSQIKQAWHVTSSLAEVANNKTRKQTNSSSSQSSSVLLLIKSEVQFLALFTGRTGCHTTKMDSNFGKCCCRFFTFVSGTMVDEKSHISVNFGPTWKKLKWDTNLWSSTLPPPPLFLR